ncbi:hypothetical protein AB1K62_13675 [Parasphingorhabdus sp. JC815]|uniref:hypothetical protein n=1 Tax=Parasphingorhabdus sp. JC815 TaxID=3232140 RepID=UPI003458BA25
MILAAILMAQTASQVEQFDAHDERYSVETQTGMMAYTTCIATGVHERREQDSFSEKDAEDVKTACQNEYDSFVANVVKDLDGAIGVAAAKNLARSFLDKLDPRAAFVPRTPANLTKLPVARLVGDWQNGRGVLATDMGVRFAVNGSIVGTISSKYEGTADGLTSWKIVSDGTQDAAFYASYTDGRLVKYNLIPSFPSEMNFINASDIAIQRYDLAIEDNDLIISYVKPTGGVSLRFHRKMKGSQAASQE